MWSEYSLEVVDAVARNGSSKSGSPFPYLSVAIVMWS